MSNRPAFRALGIAGLFAAVGPMASGCSECNSECLAGVFLVIVAPDGGPVNDVAISYTGESTGTMTCEPTNGETLCQWRGALPLGAGSHDYSLEVSAPGWQSEEVPATITVTKGACCPGIDMSPTSVTLTPAPDAGP